MFTLTKAAAEQVLQAAKQSGTDEMVLRVAASRAADGAIEYQMGFDQSSEDDIVFTSEGVKIAVAPEYVPLLDKATMDFVELVPGDQQFIFMNPLDPHYVPPKD